MEIVKIPKIGILRWESGHVPEGLMQLERMNGNSTNPNSYPFPVKMVEVKGANTETVIIHPSREVLARMIDTVKEMEKEGICAVTTSCGFNAVFQKELSEAVNIPVFTSSILQVPFAQAIIGKDKEVGIITANKGSLTREHMRACNITDESNVYVIGLEDCKEWRKIFDEPDNPFDMEAVSKEILGAVEKGFEDHPNTAIIVLECTDLPPYAQQIREKFGVPVFDINSMIGYVAMSIGQIRLYEQ